MAEKQLHDRPLIRLLAASVACIALIATSTMSGAVETPVFEQNRVPGARGFEQGINILPDGTIYVDEPPGLPSHGRAWTSTDGGVSFDELRFGTPFNRFPGGGDTDIVPSDDGRIYFLDLWGGSNSVTTSKDGGATWERGNPIVGVPTSDRQWIAIGERDELLGEDTVYVIYSKLFMSPDWTWFARSIDGGLTWTYHRPVLFDAGASETEVGFGHPIGPTGNLVADGAFLAFAYQFRGRMHVATSDDAGENWTSTRVHEDPHARGSIVSIAMDGQDLHVSYLTGDFRNVMVASSHDRGATWSEPQAVATGGTAIFPWVAARDGKVGVAWYRTDVEADRPDDVEGVWSVEYAESLDRGTTFTDPIVVSPSVKTGMVCTQGLNCTTSGSGGREFGDFIALEIGYDGMAYIAHHALGVGWVSRQLRPVEDPV